MAVSQALLFAEAPALFLKYRKLARRMADSCCGISPNRSRQSFIHSLEMPTFNMGILLKTSSDNLIEFNLSPVFPILLLQKIRAGDNT
jgi:hypothetical protein